MVDDVECGLGSDLARTLERLLAAGVKFLVKASYDAQRSQTIITNQYEQYVETTIYRIRLEFC